MSLTKMQREFAKGVARGKTYTQAALDAGYSEKTASRIGSENMTKTGILEAIDEYQEIERSAMQRRLSGVAQDMFNELIQVYYSDDTPPHVKANIFKDIFDRAGYKPVEKIETTLSGELGIAERAELFNELLEGELDET